MPLHDQKTSMKVIRVQSENLNEAVLYQSRHRPQIQHDICVWPGWPQLPASDWYNLHRWL